MDGAIQDVHVDPRGGEEREGAATVGRQVAQPGQEVEVAERGEVADHLLKSVHQQDEPHPRRLQRAEQPGQGLPASTGHHRGSHLTGMLRDLTGGRRHRVRRRPLDVVGEGPERGAPEVARPEIRPHPREVDERRDVSPIRLGRSGGRARRGQERHRGKVQPELAQQ